MFGVLSRSGKAANETQQKIINPSHLPGFSFSSYLAGRATNYKLKVVCIYCLFLALSAAAVAAATAAEGSKKFKCISKVAPAGTHLPLPARVPGPAGHVMHFFLRLPKNVYKAKQLGRRKKFQVDGPTGEPAEKEQKPTGHLKCG